MKKIVFALLVLFTALNFSACVVREPRRANWVPGHYVVGPYGSRHWVPAHHR